MVPHRAKRGSRAVGLLYYLYGPGKKDEHQDPHLVAAWDDSIIPERDPALSENATLPTLARLLEAPVEAKEGRPPKQHVYHVPVRLAPTDRHLSDAEWNTVAREILDSVGIHSLSDPDSSCRWVAVRHADDHIHIVATLVDGNGKVPNLRKDFPRMQARARELEKRLGLRQLSSGDKTAKQWPTQAELEKAARHGRTEAPRATLHARVRQAASAARDEADFFARLARAGIRVQQRIAPDGRVTGYSVALPGDRTAAGRAVWFSGSRLAPDLSLPRVRERWENGPGGSLPRPSTRAEAWQQAAGRIQQATTALARAGDAEGSGIVAALGDVLTTYAADAPRIVQREIQEAARVFERAGRAPAASRASGQARRLLSEASQCLVMGAMMAGGGGEVAAALALINALVLAAVAAYRWHQARQFRMQAEAAQSAARHLRAASEITAGAATGGRQRPRPSKGPRPVERAQYEDVVRSVLPGQAEEILTDEAWPALASTLAHAGAAGYDVSRVLGEVAAQRELGTAESVAQVLTWRLQGRMRRDDASAVTPVPAARKASPRKQENRPPQRRLGEQSEAQKAAQRATENRPRGPHR